MLNLQPGSIKSGEIINTTSLGTGRVLVGSIKQMLNELITATIIKGNNTVIPRLYNPTGRKTEAHVVEIGQNTFYFSYQTCIAFSGQIKPIIERNTPKSSYYTLRRENDWGPTTGRHFKEFGVADWETISGEEFENLLERVV